MQPNVICRHWENMRGFQSCSLVDVKWSLPCKPSPARMSSLKDLSLVPLARKYTRLTVGSRLSSKSLFILVWPLLNQKRKGRVRHTHNVVFPWLEWFVVSAQLTVILIQDLIRAGKEQHNLNHLKKVFLRYAAGIL